jgi:hypothetical protein
MPAARGNRRLMDGTNGTNGTNRTDGTNKIRWEPALGPVCETLAANQLVHLVVRDGEFG